MTQFDKTFRALAKNLINKRFGTTGTLAREASSFDVALGDNEKTTTNYTVKMSPPSPVNEQRLPDGFEVQVGDATTLLAADGLAVVPDPVRDKLVWNNDTYQVVKVQPIVSGDQNAAYRLLVRR